LAAFIILLLIHSTVFSQNYYRIRTGAFDSLAYLAQKGKFCDTALNSQLERITALQNLARTSERLSAENAGQVANLKAQLVNLQAQNQNANDLFLIEKSELKQKVKKQRRTIFGLSGVSLILLAILVL